MAKKGGAKYDGDIVRLFEVQFEYQVAASMLERFIPRARAGDLSVAEYEEFFGTFTRQKREVDAVSGKLEKFIDARTKTRRRRA